MSASSLNASIRHAILASFAADSLSLGPHWEYDTDTIAQKFNGKADRLHEPISKYHPNKTAGDQTHVTPQLTHAPRHAAEKDRIGDNAVLLLESLAAASPPSSFTVEQYISYWRSNLDHATKETLEGLKAGKTGREAASTDDDLSHSSRFFPLLAVFHDDEEKLAAVAKQLTTSFQRGDDEAATSEWLARVAYRVIVGRQKPSAAVQAVTQQLNNAFLTAAVKKGQDSAAAGQSEVEALRSYGEKKQIGERQFFTGLTCGVKYGVPAVVHAIHRYEDAADPTVALIEDVSVGGNSNARVMAEATLLFGYRGTEGFKVNEFISGLKQREHIESLLNKLQAGQK